jgi:hypothetical protein
MPMTVVLHVLHLGCRCCIVLIRKPEAQAADWHCPLNEVNYVVLERRITGPARLDLFFFVGLASHRRPDRA